MEEIRIERLTEDHFHLHSLDNFIRHQIVKECWRKVDGQWVLLPIAFVEEWSLEKCREEAAEIIRHQHGKMVDYGAFQGENLLGYITIGTEKIGTENQYVQLAAFQVSEPFRVRGVGRKLFEKAIETAKEYGAKSFIFPPIRQRNLRLPIRHWDVYTPRKSSRGLQRKNPMTCH